MPAKKWHLYVDESGRIPRDPNNPPNVPDECVVAGVLIPDDGATSERKLQEMLKRRMPWVPWPFHCAHLKQPVIHLCWLLEHASDDDAHRLAAATAHMASWAKENIAGFEQLAAEMAQLGAFNANTIKQIENQLRTQFPQDWSHFEAVIFLIRAEMLKAVGPLLPYTEANEGERARAYICGETDPGDSWQNIDVDAWCAMFVGLIIRVADSMIEEGGEHDIVVHCANRFVWYEAVARWSDMSGPFVNRAINLALAVPSLRGRAEITLKDGTSVRIRARPPVDYRDEATAYLVLADMVANEGRVCAYENGLNEAANVFEQALPFTTRIDGSPCCAISAIGNAQEHIEASRDAARPMVALANPTRRQWIEEQATALSAHFPTCRSAWR